MQGIGIQRNYALVLTSLSAEDWTDTTMLQKSCGLRQPEVSVAIRELMDIEMVEIEPQHNGQRGRPRHKYRLKGNLFEIIEPYIEEAQNELDKLESSLSHLDKVSNSLSNGAKN
uniref:Putative transcriptional regulator n=3 Tax=environmental samples TaxID=68359 RepID=A0A075FUQ4_9EURY|nr:putative transcriptional regulator [uncultured marine group II/III euryarchaeote AD1000_34_D01]AIE98316.1 putative transcriptional regulator [uncultured marine group II/III euryarchaeote KM3_05_F04]